MTAHPIHDHVGLPYEAWIVALLTLPGMGPARLGQVLEAHEAADAWERLRSGAQLGFDKITADKLQQWRQAARALSVEQHWEAIETLGVKIIELGSVDYPIRLQDDLEPPQLLFSLGEPVTDAPTVGIVGTRKCTAYGQRCAFEMGAALAEAGVSVVSGLAIGIDAAAHRGALSVTAANRGCPIGVVGSGLDIIYPKTNASLWHQVAANGTLLSETPPGVGPERWRFPARNRIIAALSDALVVVESHERGGSLLTVDEAQLRDVPVGAIPGPITSNSAAGTNRLLADGATPVLDADDVLAMIGHHRPSSISSADPIDIQSGVLDALGWSAKTLEQLCAGLSLTTVEVAMEVERLVQLGLCARSGPWIERVR